MPQVYEDPIDGPPTVPTPQVPRPTESPDLPRPPSGKGGDDGVKPPKNPTPGKGGEDPKPPKGPVNPSPHDPGDEVDPPRPPRGEDRDDPVPVVPVAPPVKTPGQLAAEAAAAAAAAEAKRLADEKIAAEKAEAERLLKEKAQRLEGYEKGYAASLGTDAADMMQKGKDAASASAAETAETTSTSAIRKAIQAARTSGVNKGQAALMGSQVAGDAYTGAYQNQLESGQNRYQQSASQFGQAAGAGAAQEAQKAQLKLQAQQLELEAKQLEAAGNAQAAAEKRQKANDIWNVIGGIAGAAVSLLPLLSDERLKENIKTDNSLDAILRKLKPSAGQMISVKSITDTVRPVNYNYKGTDQKQIGITAQDLEGSPLAGAVLNTPEGKMVDGGMLEGANLSLIIELAAEVKRLRSELKGKK